VRQGSLPHAGGDDETRSTNIAEREKTKRHV
jgi:hypothetical protein